MQEHLWPLLPDGGMKKLSDDHKKVLKLLNVSENVTKEENCTVDALKQYIKHCSLEKLSAFFAALHG